MPFALLLKPTATPESLVACARAPIAIISFPQFVVGLPEQGRFGLLAVA
jgi:hypothetical protein